MCDVAEVALFAIQNSAILVHKNRFCICITRDKETEGNRKKSRTGREKGTLANLTVDKHFAPLGKSI